MGASFGGEGDAFRSFLRLPRPPMPRRQNTLGRSRKPAASPIDARAEGQARFPGRVPNAGLRTGCQCIHMRVRRAVVRPAHQLLVSTAAARQGMRTGRDARALPKSRDPEKSDSSGPGTAAPPTCCRPAPAARQEEDKADEQNRRRHVHPGPHHDGRQPRREAGAPAGPGSPGPAHSRTLGPAARRAPPPPRGDPGLG